MANICEAQPDSAEPEGQAAAGKSLQHAQTTGLWLSRDQIVGQGDDEQGRQEDEDKGEVETARQGQVGVEGVAVIDLRFEPQSPDTQDVGETSSMPRAAKAKREGGSHVGAEADDHYVRYVVARLAAYQNVWWSMANESDLLKTKTDADFDRMFQLVQAQDPTVDYARSITGDSSMTTASHG